MKKAKVLLAALGLVVLVAGAAQAEMFLEFYLGGAFTGNGDNFSGVSNDVRWERSHSLPEGAGRVDIRVPNSLTFGGESKFDPAFMGGIKLGAWFDRSGVFSGVNFPSWMKYTGFYLDFKIHRLNLRPDWGRNVYRGYGETEGYVPANGESFNYFASYSKFGQGPSFLSSEGLCATIAFMFAARYGFFPDKEVPFGRFQPYVAVGPALMIVSQTPTLGLSGFAESYKYTEWWNGVNDYNETYRNYYYRTGKFKPDATSQVVAALAVDAGFRWMALKNVSLDFFFNWRYAQPNFSYSGNFPIYWERGVMAVPADNVAAAAEQVIVVRRGTPTRSFNATWSPTLNIFSFGVGAAYHF